MEIIRDKWGYGVTQKEATNIVDTVLGKFDFIDDFNQDAAISTAINQAWDLDGNHIGYYLSLFLSDDMAKLLPDLPEDVLTIKTARNYFRVFKTLEAAANTAKDIGFAKAHVWLNE